MTPYADLDRLVQRVHGEFREMPGMRLTTPQAARLFGVDEDLCARLMARLMAEHGLTRGADGRYGLPS